MNEPILVGYHPICNTHNDTLEISHKSQLAMVSKIDVSQLKEIVQKIVNLCQSRYQETGKPLTFVIDGNISSGKSTLMNLLQSLFDPSQVEFNYENLDLWTNVNGYNLLESYYKNPRQEALSFQQYVLTTRLETYSNPTPGKVIIFGERDPISDYVFAKFHRQVGNISQGQWEGYVASTKWMLNKLYEPPDLVLYLNVGPETCFDRKEDRNRSEEQSVVPDYFKQLHTAYKTHYPHAHGTTGSEVGFNIKYNSLASPEGSHRDNQLVVSALECILKFLDTN